MGDRSAPPPQRMVTIAGAVPVPPRPAARRQHPVVQRMNSASYFQVAYEILALHGADGITISNLCDRLNVTKGSFYYHFYSVPDFVEAFAQYWERSIVALMEIHAADPDPLRRLSGVITAIANLSHEAEAALRAWGHSNPVIAAAQLRIDRAAEQLVGDMVAAFVADPEAVRLIAHQAVAQAIGLQHRERPIDRVRYLRALASLAELTCGVRATITASPDRLAVEFHRASPNAPA